MNNDYVIVYADIDYGQREAWSVFYTNRVITKKADVDKAKKHLVSEMVKVNSDTDPSEIEFEVVPVQLI